MCPFIFNSTKSLHVIGICSDFPNNGRQKQVKATEVSSYESWKNHQWTIGDQCRRETVKASFLMLLWKRKEK